MGLFGLFGGGNNQDWKNVPVCCCANCRYFDSSRGICTNHSNDITYTQKTQRCSYHEFR